MIKWHFLTTILVTGLLSAFSLPAQDNDLKASVDISIQQDQLIWAGQQVTLNLDLKTTGVSFSKSNFNLPEVPGAFLMQTDTTTVKFSETVDGQSWQIIRYPLALYPQKAGLLEIPSIAVRFSTSAEFGSQETAYEFQTKALNLTISSPPGLKEGDLIITTSSFELDYDWQPESGAAQAGDAFTLTVKRRASDISAMLFPPLPVFRTEGLAAYPQTPELNDNTNRGDLSGERVDSIIWVIENPGSYEIPGIRFQWWDPDGRELKQQIVPGLNLEIRASPVDQATTGADDKPGQSDKNFLWLLITLITVCAVVFLYFNFRHKLFRQTQDSEKSTFATLQKACKSDHAGQTHFALHCWLAWYSPLVSPKSRPLTLSEFSRSCDDKLLGAELEQLQEALVTSDSNWRGQELLNSLKRIRRRINRQQTVQQKFLLAPLNP